MAVIRSLAVRLVADTKKFEQGMKRSGKTVSTLKTKVTAASKALTLFAQGLGLAAGAGLAVLVKQQLTAVDALAKTADKLGETTEALAGFHLAAKLTGVETNTANMALQRMVRRLAEAAQGTGEAKAALAELGLDAQRLSQLAPTAAFAEIAEAMKAVKNQSDRVRLSFKLFDSEGVALVNTLKLGKEGLAAMQKEAERLGIAISRTDARAIEDANDAIDKFKLSLAGVGQSITTELAEPLKALADIFTTKGGKALLTLLTGAAVGQGLGGKRGAAIGTGLAAIPIIANLSRVIGKAFADEFIAAPPRKPRPVDPDRRADKIVELAVTKELRKQDVLIKSFNKALQITNKLREQLLRGERPLVDGKRLTPAERPAEIEKLALLVDAIIKARNAALDARNAERERIENLDIAKASRAGFIGFGEGASGALESSLAIIKRIGPEGRKARHAMFDLANEMRRINEMTAKRLALLAESRKKSAALDASAKALFHATRTPIENIAGEFAVISKLQAAGRFDFMPDVRERAIEAIREKLRALLPEDPTAQGFLRNPALEAGSNAAFDAIQRAMGFGAEGEQKKQTAELKKLNATLEAAKKLLESLEPPELVDVEAA
ncbi:hypothetical protein LCGC14_0583250 [marine sediment metagenome]|uniref:Uncharacterized protein n=1 Tax=marine sediment metagenome TaxID=412755 RepID=A0A0F9RFR1_9ZZZZ